MKKRTIVIGIIVFICVCFTYLIVRDMKMWPTEGTIDFQLAEVIEDKERIYYKDDNDKEYVKLSILDTDNDEYTLYVEKVSDIHRVSMEVRFTVQDAVAITGASSKEVNYDILNKNSHKLNGVACEIRKSNETDTVGALSETVWARSYKGFLSMSSSGYLSVRLSKNGISEVSWHI